MAAVSTVVAVAGLALATGGAALSYAGQRRQAANERRAEREQEKAQAEASAQRASEAAAERRQQIREQRIKRGQILQAAENTGTEGGSGEAGALGSISTQLGTNLGTNQAGYQRGQRISMFNQNAANFMGDARSAASRGQMFSSLGQLGQQAFSAAGGFKTLMGTPKGQPSSNVGGWMGNWDSSFTRVG